VRSMHSTKRAKFLEFELPRRIFLVFRRGVVPTLAGTACKGDNISHINTSVTEKITPLLPGAG